MRVSRSLTIKHMAMIFAMTFTTIFLLIVMQLFYLVQQYKTDTTRQLESIAQFVQQPLQAAIVQADLPQAERILHSLHPFSLLAIAHLSLPSDQSVMYAAQTKPISSSISQLLHLPIQLTVPFAVSGMSSSATLVLQADPQPFMQSMMRNFGAMLFMALCLALIVPMLINWGRHAQMMKNLPNKIWFLEQLARQLDNVRAQDQTVTIIVLRIETLLEANGIVRDSEREALARVMVNKIHTGLADKVRLAQLSVCDFALLIEHIETPEHAQQLAGTLLHQLTQPVLLQHMLLRPNLSIGITQAVAGHANAADVLSRGIAAMMAARYQGKNQILTFDAALTARTEKRLTREYEILQSIEAGLFALWLQPQVDMRTGEVTGAEALLRMKQPDGSWRLPVDLIVDAEEIGAINALGHWVFTESCRLLAAWQQQGLPLTLSVNLSPIQLRDTNMAMQLKALLTQYDIPADRLVLEVTETAQMKEPEGVLPLLNALYAAGISVALDDFGMGYANLDWLNQFRLLPTSKIKIDRSFVAALPADDTMVRIVAAIAELTELSLIAEGIETLVQRDWLLAHNIVIGQGYFYSPPLSQQAFAEYYFAHRKPNLA